MIDWMTALLPLPDAAQSIDWRRLAGYTMHARPGGEIEKIVDQWLPIAGSFEKALRVRISSAGLWISGNPTKFLTGQNADGPDCAAALLHSCLARVAGALSAPYIATLSACRLTRIDCTYSYDLGSIERVREVLRVASLTARARHQGRSHTSYQTVYLGQHSRRHSVKLYAKADEVAQHPPFGLPTDVESDLRAQAQGLLRVEVTARRLELEQTRMADIASWKCPSAVRRTWQRYWGRVEINAAMDLIEEEALALPRRLRGTYELWRRGVDCFAFLSTATYYRHRKDLLRESHGKVDIAIIRPSTVAGELACENVGAWLHSLTPWQSNGRLSDWIAETAMVA